MDIYLFTAGINMKLMWTDYVKKNDNNNVLCMDQLQEL